MKVFRKIKNAFKLFFNKDFRFQYLSGKGLYNDMPDEKYLERFYRAHTGKTLDWSNLRTFNEKLQWLKIHDRKPEYTQMVDKAGAKEYVAEKLGTEYIIPTYGVWERFEDIDFDALPNQFVLKCTHGSGDLIICRDKSAFDIEKARSIMTKFLKREFYYYGREWPYKNVPPRILAEKYMCDNENDKDNLTDYKIFCFDGKPRYIMTVRDRSKGKGKSLHRWYDLNWQLQDLDLDYRDEIKTPEPRPTQLDKMLEIAETLSAGMRHLRVDLYLINGDIYFGEMTFYHMSGCEHFEPATWDLKLGEYLNIDI